MKKSESVQAALDRLRARIDQLNLELLGLISERAHLAAEIGRLKKTDGTRIYQPVRERAVIERIVAENPGPLSGAQLERIFTEIISACRAMEHVPRVAYLGPEHTYSHEAARSHFGSSAAFVAQGSIAEVFHAIENGRAEFGVVPVENSTEGSVTLTLDLLIDTPLVIIGEVLFPIRHALLSLSGKAASIRRIVSHQQSLAQCRRYLMTKFPHCPLETVASNAAAARRAGEEPSLGAIASLEAAQSYGLKVVAESIQDLADNATRFLVMGTRAVEASGRDKTTVLFAVPDRVGALYQALGVFSRSAINISKIESRPMRARPWEYLFFADLGGHRDEPRLKRAIAALKLKALFLKVLGSYPEGKPAVSAGGR